MRQKGAGNAASLNLEAPAVPPSSCLLKLPALCADIWLGVAVRDTRSFAKVPNSFPGVLGTPQENRVLSKRSTEGELVKGKALATSIDYPSPRRLGEPERGHLHRRHLVDPLVVGDGAHDHSDLVSLSLHEPDEAAHRERRTVGLAHEQAFQDHGVEVALGPPHQEAVELDEQLEVDIVRFGLRALGPLVAAAGFEVDTLVAKGTGDVSKAQSSGDEEEEEEEEYEITMVARWRQQQRRRR
jgi:hypothetical protein